MPGLPSLVFVWPSNCGSLQLGRDDGGQALAHVLAGEVLVLLLELALLARVAVERARERRAEARQVRAALVRVDVVGEREDGLLVGGVPLHRDLDRALLALALEEDDLLLDRVLVLVEVGDEVLDAALVVELGRARPSPRSSVIVIRRPRVRNAVSRRRCSSVAYSKSSVSKISASGRKVIVVPVSLVGSPLLELALRRAALVAPGVQTWPSRRTSTSSRSDSALTTETPTPCRPPETL